MNAPGEPKGHTAEANLTLLCSRHHHACHEGRFTVTRVPHGALQFRRPDNTIIDPRPRPG